MKWLSVFLLIIFAFYFFLFKDRVWFFNDSFNDLLDASQTPLTFILSPYNEHWIPISKIFYLILFKLFKLNFTYYFIISILLHLLNILVLYKISKFLTKSNYFSNLVLFLYSVNVNFFEIILWGTFDILLCTLFIGLAFLFWLRNKLSLSVIFAICAALSNGMGLGYPLVLSFLSLIKGKSDRRKAIIYAISGFFILSLYFIFSKQNLDGVNFIKIFYFLYIGLVYGLFLRFFFPLFPTRFLVLNNLILPILIASIVIFSYLIFTKTKLFLKITMLVNIVYLYLIISLKRATISPWEAVAERYQYIPLFFLIIYLVSQLSLLKKQKWLKPFCIFFVVYYLLTQSIVFYKRGFIFTKTTLANKIFFSELARKVKKGEVEPDCKTPAYPATPKNNSCSRYFPLLGWPL